MSAEGGANHHSAGSETNLTILNQKQETNTMKKSNVIQFPLRGIFRQRALAQALRRKHALPKALAAGEGAA